jgi:ABC-type multidrug transport system ATPase subunit
VTWKLIAFVCFIIHTLVLHSGAGKTSTVSVLTGLFPPTSGDVSIYGHSIVDELTKARESIGICPQHNVLFDRLTVMEHLKFFSKIKGVSYENKDLEASALEIGLTEDQLRTTASALSGGNQRKLSVAIALCGDPKFLILDEPTSAMDPTARRLTWQVLRRKRAGRVTLLTTHFMDEAEHLSDRVAVMKDGELQCCGSPLYLKDKYNLGWNLTVVIDKPDCEGAVDDEYAGIQLRVTAFLKQYIPQAELVRRSGRELTYCFPKGTENQFPDAFDAFEQQAADLGVSSYGIENASFEEVFLLLAEKDSGATNEENDDGIFAAEAGSGTGTSYGPGFLATASDNVSVVSSKLTADSGDTASTNSDDWSIAADPKVNEKGFKDTESLKSMSAIRQIGLLYWKRAVIQKRDWKGAFFAIIVPVLLVALVILVLTANIFVSGPPIEMSPSLYENSYSSRGDAKTQILFGGGAGAEDKSVVETDYIYMHAGMHRDYPNAAVTHLDDASSSVDLSRYLLDTYNDHDRPVRFGTYSVEDLVAVNINVNFTAFREQIRYYENKKHREIIKLRDQRVDLLDVLGVTGRSGRFYWRMSAGELAEKFLDVTSMNPWVRFRTVSLAKGTSKEGSQLLETIV